MGIKMFRKLMCKTRVRDDDVLKDDLKDSVDTRTSVESPTPSWVSMSSSCESGFQLSPHALNEIDTELDNFEIVKPQRSAEQGNEIDTELDNFEIVKPQRSAEQGDNIQSSADATEVIFEEPRDPAHKSLVEEVEKVLAPPSFEECSTASGKPGEGRNVRIALETKDHPSLLDADKAPKPFTRTTSETGSIPGHGVYLGDRAGVFVPQQLLEEPQLEKEQREAAQVEKDLKELQQSEKENPKVGKYSLKSTRKARFADDDSLYVVIKTPSVPIRHGVPKRRAADDESSIWAPSRYSQATSDDESSVFSYGSSVVSAGASEYTSGTDYSTAASEYTYGTGYSTGASEYSYGTGYSTGSSAHSTGTSTGFFSAESSAYTTGDEESSVCSGQTGFSASTGYTDDTRQLLNGTESSDVSVDRSYRTSDTSSSEGSVERMF